MTQHEPIARFDGKTISYAYDNGWAFSNTFEGNIRVTDTPRRGELREPVQVRELRPDVFLVSWIDGEMGLLAQIIDLENGTVIATIPSEDDPTQTAIISATGCARWSSRWNSTAMRGRPRLRHGECGRWTTPSPPRRAASRTGRIRTPIACLSTGGAMVRSGRHRQTCTTCRSAMGRGQRCYAGDDPEVSTAVTIAIAIGTTTDTSRWTSTSRTSTRHAPARDLRGRHVVGRELLALGNLVANAPLVEFCASDRTRRPRSFTVAFHDPSPQLVNRSSHVAQVDESADGAGSVSEIVSFLTRPDAPFDDHVLASSKQFECEPELKLLDADPSVCIPEVDPGRHHPVVRTHPSRTHGHCQVTREGRLPAARKSRDHHQSSHVGPVCLHGSTFAQRAIRYRRGRTLTAVV